MCHRNQFKPVAWTERASGQCGEHKYRRESGNRKDRLISCRAHRSVLVIRLRIDGAAGLLPMKTTPFHHTNRLSSFVAFNAEEDRRRRTKKTYIVLSPGLVLPARNVVFQMGRNSEPIRLAAFYRGDALAHG